VSEIEGRRLYIKGDAYACDKCIGYRHPHDPAEDDNATLESCYLCGELLGLCRGCCYWYPEEQMAPYANAAGAGCVVCREEEGF